jgi:hypothetical protein
MKGKMRKEHKEWIDNASYDQLLSKWRHAPLGDPFFMDDTGEYYSRIMGEKKIRLSHSEQVGASKRIGWE